LQGIKGKQERDLSFNNHLINITLEFIDAKSLCKEAKLLLPNRIVDIKDHSRSKSRDIEAINLLLAEIRLGCLEEMGRHLGTNQEGDVLMDKIQGEYTAELWIFLPQHNNGTFEEAEEATNQRRPGFYNRR